MNISCNWLRQYLDSGMTPEQIADALTSIGLETGSIEEVESIRGGLKGLVVGRVLTCTGHPDSDHLHITTVDLGEEQPAQIVCGAPNVAAGQTVIVATIGTTLYSGDSEFKIKKSKIRGVESFGMICAEDEIGVGTSHDDIIVIHDDVKPGTPAAEYFNLTSDHVLEVDLTPNRIDAASHFGVARDLAAWMDNHATHRELRRPAVDSFAVDRHDGAVSVRVDAPEACTRYSGITIRGIKVAESPKWLKDRLNAIGQRPINNIVDITNYILHGIGQPLHCFDLAKIKGGEIIVRTCSEGTPFTTLDGVERKLHPADLMICNTEEPMCLAGVFGGLDSGVTEATADIFIESACFNPTSVRKSARRHGLSTDSSFRFERGVDPNGTMYALRLAAILVKQLAGGEICGDPIDIYPSRVEPARVELTYSYIDSLVGKNIPADTVKAIARSLEMEITEETTDGLTLLIPTYRVDVTRPCDVVEDILRIYGYNNVEISTTVHSCLQGRTPTDRSLALTATILDRLAAMGFNEIMNNSLTAAAYYDNNPVYPADTCVRLLNPLSNDLSVMRRTLLYGGLESIAHNINRRIPNLMMVETGNVYTLDPQALSTAEAPLAPFSESSRMALWITGTIGESNWLRQAPESTVYDLIAIVEQLMDTAGLSRDELKWTPVRSPLYSSAIEVATRSGKPLGTVGTLSRAVLKPFEIKQSVHFAELDRDALLKAALRKHVTYSPLPKTHPVRRDLALLLDSAVTMQQVKDVITRSERKLLRDVTLFDVYEGEHLPEGKKSYAVSLTLQDPEKTLQDKQIETVMTKVINALAKELGASLR